MKSSQKNKIIIISGVPASGKTTLSRMLAEELSLPLFSSDGIKEILFDHLGYDHEEELFNKFGKASFEVLYMIMEKALSTGVVGIVEANFHPKYNSNRINRLLEKYQGDVFYIYCIATPDVVERRFKKRLVSGSRHPGFRDDKQKVEEANFVQHMIEKNGPLDIHAIRYDFDSSDIQHTYYDELLLALKEFLKK